MTDNNYSPDHEFVRTSYATEQMLGHGRDVLEVAAKLVDEWLNGSQPELVAAIRSLKRAGENDQDD